MPSMLDGQRSPIGSLAKLGEGVRANSDAKTQSGLGRGAGQSKKLVNAAWTQTFPAQGATLDLDFANDRGYVRGVGQGRSMDAVTFTRASNGTFVKPDGTLSQYSNQGALGLNLLTFPQNFENAVWTKDGASVVLNTISAPDGTNTASLLLESSANSQHRIFQLPTGLGISGVRSIYAKSRGNNRFLFIEDSGASAWFNIENGTLGTVNAGGTATITSVGDGWYRCTLKGDSTGSIYAIYGLSNADNVKSYVGDGTSGLFIWGAQLEVGSTATEYFPTNINTPRFDWASTVQLGGNLLINSDYPTSWGYSSVAPTYNATTDPEGTNNAVLLTENNSSGHFASIGVSLVAGNTYTISAYFKDNTRRYASLMMSNFNNASSNFDLTNVVSVLGTGITASIEAVGNGWYRCSMTFTATNTTNSNAIFGLNNSANGLGSQSYVSEGKSLYLYAPQVNLGSTATTYFKTGAQLSTNTPLLANPTSNGLLIEESRANRILWCRDATQNLNYLTYSQDFTQAYWLNKGVVVTANVTTAPDSTNTGTKLIGSTPSEETYPAIIANQNLISFGTSTTIYVASVYAKASELNYLVIGLPQVASNNNHGLVVDLTTGSFTRFYERDNIPVTGLVEDAGNGWKRISIATVISNNNGYAVAFGVTDTMITGTAPPTYTGNGTSGIFIWGAQLEFSAVGNYVLTNGTALTAGWTKQNATVAKNQVGVDGVSNACTSITATANNAICLQTIGITSGSRTASVYLKRITGTGNVQVTLDGITYSTVDLSTSEWRRIVLSGTVTNPTVGIRIVTSGDAVAMDFGQVEDGAFATTPILTTTASITRSSDVASITGVNFNNFYNQSGGTVQVNFNSTNTIFSDRSPFSITGSGLAICGMHLTSSALRAEFNAPAAQISLIIGLPSNQGVYNAVISYNQNSYALGYVNGLYTTSQLNFPRTNGIATGLAIGSGWNGNIGANPLGGYISRVIYSPKIVNIDATQVLSGRAT